MAQDTTSTLERINSRYEAGMNTKHKGEWYLNLAFYLGEQYVKFENVTNTLVVPKKPSYRVRLTINQIMPRVRTELAKLTQGRHKWEVLPSTSEEEDINVADIATKFLDAKWRELDMERIRQDLVMWCIVCGTSFLEVYWDDEIHIENLVPSVDPYSQDPKLDDMGAMIFEPRQLTPDIFAPVGDIAVERITPFEITPDPMATNIQDSQWIIKSKEYSKEQAENIYDITLDDKECFTSDPKSHWEVMLNSLYEVDRTAREEQMTLVKELWERPNDEYTEGRHVIIVGNNVVYDDVNGFPGRDLPFVMFKHIPVPGQFWGQGSVQQLRPLQKEFNRSKSQVVEIKNRTSNPQRILPTACGVDASSWTSEPGLTLPVKSMAPGYEPHYIQAPNVPSYVFQHIKDLLEDMDEVGGQHEVSRGEVPTGVKSGVAIRFLQERDDTKLGPIARGYERSWERCGALWLKMAREFYRPMEERILKYVGPNKEVSIIDFSAQDLPLEPDVIVVSGSSLPDSKTGRQQFLLELWQAGVFMDYKTGKPDPQKLLSMLELGGGEDIAFEEVSTDVNTAQLENRKLEKGMPVEVHEWENHAIHIQQHNKRRRQTDFELVDPVIRAAFKQHVQIHKAAAEGGVEFNQIGTADLQLTMQKAQMVQKQMQEAQMRAAASGANAHNQQMAQGAAQVGQAEGAKMAQQMQQGAGGMQINPAILQQMGMGMPSGPQGPSGVQ
jgi:hypothetical protein